MAILAVGMILQQQKRKAQKAVDNEAVKKQLASDLAKTQKEKKKPEQLQNANPAKKSDNESRLCSLMKKNGAADVAGLPPCQPDAREGEDEPSNPDASDLNACKTAAAQKRDRLQQEIEHAPKRARSKNFSDSMSSPLTS